MSLTTVSTPTGKRIYHKPLYGLTKEQCLTKKYRRFMNGRCSYRKCRGKSHFYNKYGKCLSMKHYGDVEPSRKKKYRGKNLRRICETSKRGKNWRFYDGKCYKKTCKTRGSVFAYYNGRCTPRAQYFKHLIKKFRAIEHKAENRIRFAKTQADYTDIYKNAKEDVNKVKEDANKILNKIKADPTKENIKIAKDENIIDSKNAEDLQGDAKSAVIEKVKHDIDGQGFTVLENIKNRIRKV